MINQLEETTSNTLLVTWGITIMATIPPLMSTTLTSTNLTSTNLMNMMLMNMGTTAMSMDRQRSPRSDMA